MITLYGNSVWTSPYVLSCFVTLKEKSIPFVVETIELHQGAQHEKAFADRSATSRVPMLVDGDFTLSESSAIVEYLEEKQPLPPVLPKTLRERARARQVMAWIRSDLMPIREERSAEYVFYKHDQLAPFAPLSEAGARAADKLFATATRLLSGRMSLFETWSVADTDLAMMLMRLVKTGHDVPKPLAAYAHEQWKRDSVQAFVAQDRPPYAAST